MKAGLRSVLFCGLAGELLAVAVANPWDGEPVWWLSLFSLSVLAWQVNQATDWRTAAWRAWCFASIWLSMSFWWLYIAMHTYGGLPAWLAVLAVLALAGALALIYAGFCAGYWVLRATGAQGRGVLFALMWMLAELARANWLTGFGWGGVAYSHVAGPLSAYAPWIGAFGIAAVAAWLAMRLANIFYQSHGGRLATLAILLLPWACSLIWPSFTDTTGRLQVALLQGNIPQNEKFQPGSGLPLALRWYAQQLQDNRAKLIVTPETAVPLLPPQLPPHYLNAIAQRYASGEQAALIGIPLGDYRDGYTNSMLGFKPGQTAQWRYDKHHLVPFGEFIPPFFKWFTQLMRIPLGDFQQGGVDQASFEWQGQRLAPNICYEDLFGDEMGARFRVAEQAPTVLVNSSNIAWFGNTIAIDQHLAISRMRALEFERPMIRATNTGATVIIDHRGKVTHSLPRHTQGVLLGEVEGRSGTTPYAWWVSRLGLWPLWLVGVVVIMLLWQRKAVSPAGSAYRTGGPREAS